VRPFLQGPRRNRPHAGRHVQQHAARDEIARCVLWRTAQLVNQIAQPEPASLDRLPDGIVGAGG